ncbi:MAG: hypothetical protein ACYTAF_00225, partial [Planctomycetota bacterium]
MRKRTCGMLAVLAFVAVTAAPGGAPAAVLQEDGDMQDFMTLVNEMLELRGENVRLAVVETQVGVDADTPGQTVRFNNRDFQMGSHWVPNDPLRGWGTEIPWADDLTDGATSSGLTYVDTALAIVRAMDTLSAANGGIIPLTFVGHFTFDIGYVQYLYGFGGYPGYIPGITHGGWLPKEFFGAIQAGGAEKILGVTFTFVWVYTGSGVPTDLDGNGKMDVAFREIYYNDFFLWVINQDLPDVKDYDVETVALHEAGHGVSMGHFGKIFK